MPGMDMPGCTSSAPTTPAASPVAQTYTVDCSGFLLHVATDSTPGAGSMDDDQVKVTITSPVGGWIGFGQGAQMVGSVALIGVDAHWNPGMRAVAWYALNGDGGASEMPRVSDAPEASFAVAGTTTQLQVTLRRGSLSPYMSQAFSSAAASSIILAVGGGPYDYHNGVAVVSLPLYVTATNLTAPLPLRGAAFKLDAAMIAHVIMMLLCFCVLLPLGASLALTRTSIKLHRRVQIAGAALGLWGVVPAVASRRSAHLTTSHDGLGLALVLVLLTQVVAGVARPHLGWKRRHAWLLLHRALACVILGSGILNAFLGVIVALPKYTGNAASLNLGAGDTPIAVIDNAVTGVALLGWTCVCGAGIARRFMDDP